MYSYIYFSLPWYWAVVQTLNNSWRDVSSLGQNSRLETVTICIRLSKYFQSEKSLLLHLCICVLLYIDMGGTQSMTKKIAGVCTDNTLCMNLTHLQQILTNFQETKTMWPKSWFLKNEQLFERTHEKMLQCYWVTRKTYLH